MVVVAINAGRSTRRIDLTLNVGLSDGAFLEEAWSHRSVRLEQGMLRGLELEAPRGAGPRAAGRRTV